MDAAPATAAIGHNSRFLMDIVADDPGVVFRDPEVLPALVAEIEAEIAGRNPDTETDKGRKAIASLAYAIARRKTAIDEAGKELNEDARRAMAKVDAVRRDVRDRLDALRDKARKPLDAWEKQEAVRIANVEHVIAALREAAVVRATDTAASIAASIELIEATVIGEDFGERRVEAETLRAVALSELRAALEIQRQREAEAVELARLRAEQAERDRLAREAKEKAEAEAAEAERIAIAAKQAEERARQEAEKSAQLEREQREERHAAELKAAQDRAAAAERAQREREEAARREEQARTAEAKRLADEEASRAADIAHRSQVMGAAKEALIEHAGLSEGQAKKAVLAISGGHVPAVTIRF